MAVTEMKGEIVASAAAAGCGANRLLAVGALCPVSGFWWKAYKNYGR
jgi:hypothetical protein